MEKKPIEDEFVWMWTNLTINPCKLEGYRQLTSAANSERIVAKTFVENPSATVTLSSSSLPVEKN